MTQLQIPGGSIPPPSPGERRSGLALSGHPFLNPSELDVMRADSADESPVQTINAASDAMSAEKYAEAQLRDERREPGFFRVVADAVNSEWVSSWAMRQMSRSGYEIDPTFRVTEESTWKAVTNGLPPELIEGAFDDAVSLDHALKIREQMISVMHSRVRLSEAGWGGTAATIGAMVLDPVALAATIGSGGALGTVGYGTKLTRLQRMVRGGFVVGATEATLQSYIASEDPERDADDVVLAGVLAFALGGAGTVWHGAGLDRVARSWQRQIELDQIERAGLTLTDKGRAVFKAELAGESRSTVMQRLFDSIEDMPQDTRDVLAKMTPDEQLSWINARTPVARQEAQSATSNALNLAIPDRQPGDFSLAGAATPSAESGLGNLLRFDMGGILARSSVPETRRLAHFMAENPIPRKDGTPTIQSATEWKGRLTRTYIARYQRVAHDEFTGWRKANGRGGPLSWASDRVEFMEEVGKAMRFERGAFTANPHVNKVADLQRDLFAELLGVAKRYRVRGFEAVDARSTYVPRIYSTSKLHRAVDQFGEKNVIALFRTALLSQSDELTAEQAHKLATVHLRNTLNLDRTTHLQKARLFDPDQSELLRQVLRDEFADITDAQVEDIIYAVKARPNDAGVPARAKRRLAIDETVAIDVPGIGKLRVDDLLENSGEVLMELYTRQILGHSAMAEVFRAMARSDEDIITNFDQLLARVEDDSKAAGLSRKKINRDMTRLSIMHKSLVDLPLGGEFGPRFAEWSRHLRGLQFMRVMGQAGFPQAVETAMIAGEVGLPRFLRHIPTAMKLIRGARSGQQNGMTTLAVRDIETIWGFGTERIRNQVTSRMDAAEAMRDFGGGKLDVLMRAGQKFTGDVSLLTPISMAQQRMAAGAAMDKWADIAATGAKMPSAMRLASMGLLEADGQRIITQIRSHAKTYKGVTGATMHDLNLSAWKDVDAASKFIVAIDKWTRRVVQHNDIGNLAHWMTYDTAKIILQFRLFPMVSWSKHLLHGARMADWQVANTFMLGMTLSGLMYTGRTYLNSIGRSDKQQYLDERLSWKNITAGAFYHNSYASLLPFIADTGAQLADVDPPFQFTRSTGLSTGVFSDSALGNPSADWLDQTAKALRGGARLVRPDKTFTQSDARAISRTLPFQNVLGIKTMIEIMTGQLPERGE